jgi:hypothetical protein
MGVITAAFGGVLRDVVCNEIPKALHDHRPYAICAFVGGWVLVGASTAGLAGTGRWCWAPSRPPRCGVALWRDLRLPGWSVHHQGRGKLGIFPPQSPEERTMGMFGGQGLMGLIIGIVLLVVPAWKIVEKAGYRGRWPCWCWSRWSAWWPCGCCVQRLATRWK